MVAIINYFVLCTDDSCFDPELQDSDAISV